MGHPRRVALKLEINTSRNVRRQSGLHVLRAYVMYSHWPVRWCAPSILWTWECFAASTNACAVCVCVPGIRTQRKPEWRVTLLHMIKERAVLQWGKVINTNCFITIAVPLAVYAKRIKAPKQSEGNRLFVWMNSFAYFYLLGRRGGGGDLFRAGRVGGFVVGLFLKSDQFTIPSYLSFRI